MKLFLEIFSEGGEYLQKIDLPLNSPQITVGKSSDCTIVLNYPTVSKNHGKIETLNGQVWFTDLNSKNGTFLEKIPLRAAEKTFWESGTWLSIGPYKLQWQENKNKDSSLSSKQNPQILKDLAEFYLNVVHNGNFHKSLKDFGQILKEKIEEAKLTNKDSVFEKIYYEVHDHGPLKDVLFSPTCKEILINRYDEIYLDEGKGLFLSKRKFISYQTYERWLQKLINKAGKRLDLQNPICEATLEDGARLHAVTAPICNNGLSVSIRRFGSAPMSEKDALKTQWIDFQKLSLLKTAIKEKKNIVISGGTSTGKTSLLNFLCQFIEPNERIITIEDTIELKLPVQNVVQLQARKPNADGIGKTTLRELVQCSLRMRPDRIILGECRGEEVLELLQVLNTGHPGSMTTVHANSPADALTRLELLALLGAPNLDLTAIQYWIRSTIDLVVQLERTENGHRFISEIKIVKQNADTNQMGLALA